MPTRCFMPPESCAGFFISEPSEMHQARVFERMLADCASRPAGWREETASSTLPSADSHGISAWPWKITARSRLGPTTCLPSAMMLPSLGAVEAGQDVEDGGLAASRVTDHAGELAFRHSEPDILEDGQLAAAASSGKRRVKPSTLMKDVLMPMPPTAVSPRSQSA